jgi:hypothetical protein
MLSPSQLQSLETNGYLLIPAGISAGAVAELSAALSELPAAHAHRNLLQHAAIGGFSRAAETLSLITPVVGAGAFPVRAILFDKLPGANWKVAWHQDLAIPVNDRHELAGFGPWSSKEGIVHVQPPACVLENMLTLRLHLDDCDDANGPLRVLPGSHRRGILPADGIQRLRTEISEVAAILPAGGVLLMRPLLLHASSPAANPRHRRVLHIEYASMPLPHPLRWHTA